MEPVELTMLSEAVDIMPGMKQDKEKTIGQLMVEARNKKLSSEERKKIAQIAAHARWEKEKKKKQAALKKKLNS